MRYLYAIAVCYIIDIWGRRHRIISSFGSPELQARPTYLPGNSSGHKKFGALDPLDNRLIAKVTTRIFFSKFSQANIFLRSRYFSGVVLI